jgi:hypothetical protein
MSLNTHAVRGLVDELDQLVPREGTSVAVKIDRPDTCELLANRAGYLRLGIELMQAGLAEAPVDGHAVDADLGYLFDQQSPALLGPLLRRTDDPGDDEAQAAFQKKFRGAFMLLMGLFAILAAIGMVGVAVWFTS